MNERSVIISEADMGSRRRNKELLTEQRRKQILDAALAVFSKKGYGESTIPDIAREGGMAVGTIYNYYPSKRDILVSVLAGNVLSEPFVQLMEQSPEADDRAFFRSLIQERLTMLNQNADRLIFMVGEIYRDPEFRKQWTMGVVEPALKRAEKRVTSRIDSGAFRPMNASITVRALAGMAIGFAVLAMIEGEESPTRDIPTEELAAQLADIAMMGVRASDSDLTKQQGQ
jgi:AcrR family transcriptional regulator